MRALVLAPLVLLGACNLLVDFEQPVESDAQCTDGVDNDGNGLRDCEEPSCSDQCGSARCGDGNPDPDEECDDGNPLPFDGCEPVTCTYTCASGVDADTRGFDPTNGHCYLGFTDGLGALYAQAACADLGGYLAVPDSPGEDARIRAAAPGDASLGLADGVPDDQRAFTLVTGNLPASYLHFSAGEPDQPLDVSSCVSYDGALPTWQDNDCLTPLPYVCELHPMPCGDLVVQPTELCDDGNNLDGDDCPANCGGVDECALGLDNCSPDADCIDQPGVPGFACICHGGLVGDGTSCVPLPPPPTFTPRAPVAVTGTLENCTTVSSAAGRKIAIDQFGILYALMRCPADEARVTVSVDAGATWSPPVLVGTGMLDGAIVGAVAGRAIVALVSPAGDVTVRQTQDLGASWGPTLTVEPLVDTLAGISLATDGLNVVAGFRSSSGTLRVIRFDPLFTMFTGVDPIAVSSGDVLIDPAGPGDVWAAGDDGSGYHLRVSTDGGVTFPDVDHTPSGSQAGTDWAIGGGLVFATGSGDAVDVIATDVPDSSTQVLGLGGATAGGERAIAADGAGNAVVVQSTGTGIELIHLPVAASAFDAAVPVSAAGQFPGIVLWPGGLAVVTYTMGTQVWVGVIDPG